MGVFDKMFDGEHLRIYREGSEEGDERLLKS